jgi:allantoin racemase
MRVWWQSSTPLDSERMADYRAHLVAHVTGVARPDTQVHFSGVDAGSLALDYDAVVELNSMSRGGVLHKIVQAEAEGFDVVAIGCMLDPALDEARELVGIPIVSLGETTLLVSCMLGDRVSGVAFSDKQALRYTRQAYAMGLNDRVEPFESLGIDFPTLAAGFREPEPMVEGFRRAARRLVDRGVEVIIPACATLDLFLAEAHVDEVEGARVLHADAMLLKMAETFAELAGLGVTISRKLKYAGPTGRRREEILAMYGIEPVVAATR